MYPTAMEIWEPFCGGGAVTLALSRVGFKVHASDSHEDLILMWQAAMRGESEPFADVSEAEHATIRFAAPSARRGFVGFGASFGGVWFGGFARHSPGKGVGYSCDSPRMANGKFHAWHESHRSLQRLRGRSVEFTHAQYTTAPDNSLVYADPPYVGTAPYKGAPDFDHAAFWQWVRERKGPTFVSELTAPDGMQIVWRKAHKSQMTSNSPTSRATSGIVHREERLYYCAGRQ
jgi:hypothetical protein